MNKKKGLQEVSALTESGKKQFQNKNYSRAIEKFQKILDLCPEDEAAHFELGKVFYLQGKYIEAITELQRTIKLNPQNKDAYILLAKSNRIYGRYKEAVQGLKKAQELESDDKDIFLELSSVYQELSQVYLKENDYDMAIKQLRNALKANPSDTELHSELGKLYLMQGEFNKAVTTLKNALAIEPDKPERHMELGDCYRRAGETEKAVKEFEQAAKLGYDKAAVLDIIQELYDKVSTAQYGLGKIYRKQGKAELAIKAFQKSLSHNPGRKTAFVQNKILNEIEITKRKTILESMPRVLGITLTTRCNLRCIMCGTLKVKWDIPDKTIIEITELLPYTKRVLWQGGEVFLSPHFKKLYEHAASFPQIEQLINTNGLFFNEKWAGILSEGKVTIAFSIDGVTRPTYEYIRQGGKFPDLLKGINIINKYKQRYTGKMGTTLDFVVMKANYREIEKVIDFAQKYRFDGVFLRKVEGINEEDIFFNNKDIKKYLAGIIDKLNHEAQEHKINFVSMVDVDIPKESEEEEKSMESSGNQKRDDSYELLCYWPWQGLFINPPGNVKPECACYKDVGSIESSTLKELWNNKIMQMYRRKIIDHEYHNWCNPLCTTGNIPEKRLHLEEGSDD